MMRGTFFIIVGPGGVGKNTVQSLVLEAVPEMVPVRGVITRPIRPGEQADSDRISVEKLLALKQEGLITAYVEINGNHYGTLKQSILEPLADGKDAIRIFTIDGARAALQDFPDENIVTIFLDAPLEMCKRRQEERGDDPQSIEARLKLGAYERSRRFECDFVVDAIASPAGVAKEVTTIILDEIDDWRALQQYRNDVWY